MRSSLYTQGTLNSHAWITFGGVFRLVGLALTLLPIVLVASEPNQSIDPMATLDNRHRLGPGDEISFRVIEDRDPAVSFLVTDSGEVDFPYIGRRNVKGFTCKQVAFALKPVLEKDFYYKATVLVALNKLRKSRGKAYVSGGVEFPKYVEIPIEEKFTVSKAVILAGGFTKHADRSAIKVIRTLPNNTKRTIVVDLEAAFEGKPGAKDIDLQPDDMVIVPKQGALGQVYLSGAIVRPGAQMITPGVDYTVSKAILAAGGFQRFSDKRKVKIIRPSKDGSPSKEIIVDVKAILEGGRVDLDVKVQSEDRIIVPERAFNF